MFIQIAVCCDACTVETGVLQTLCSGFLGTRQASGRTLASTCHNSILAWDLERWHGGA